MSLSGVIARHLPFLRRYARALTGSPYAADAVVHATLQAIVNAPERLDGAVDPRVGLYRVFHDIWASNPPIAPRPTSPPGSIVARLGDMRVSVRQALLLTGMEGFTEAEAAEILLRTPEEIADMVNGAITELAVRAPQRALIIEDEPATSLDLADIITEMGHRVTAIVSTRAAAVAEARLLPPDFVLADVQLADGDSGLETVAEILQDRPVPVIFITGHPERLLTGHRPDSTFMVSKPFAVECVKSMIGHALFVATA